MFTIEIRYGSYASFGIACNIENLKQVLPILESAKDVKEYIVSHNGTVYNQSNLGKGNCKKMVEEFNYSK